MQTTIIASLRHTQPGRDAEHIIRSCVHCGFCNATCPTYQLLGDELDGPRGRIYQIKQILEGQPATEQTQLHLDRCLTCRNCETTCPSGVRYGNLLDIGRHYLEVHRPRPLWQRIQRRLVLMFILNSRLFGSVLFIAQRLRALLPQSWRRAIPVPQPWRAWPTRQHARKMLLLEGCVQPLLAPSINAAAATVLNRLDIQLLRVTTTGCCGAASHHTSATESGKALARRNIDAWWPQVEAGAEAIVITASGCGVHVKDYGRLLAADPAYADKATRIAQLTRDISEILATQSAEVLRPLFKPRVTQTIAVHTPCTLQHGQGLPDNIESILRRCGYSLTRCEESHQCCGSAGTYSLLQPRLARQLRARKLHHLLTDHPARIVTANIGCLSHLAAGTDTPVNHWIELLAESVYATPA
ncbi:MAG: glycolate oxidase subunit GlcF [Gammaproteobacteria bacterium]|nr:glycolate oxidase subunit GlcF [Gammaproteobacteria bacterium]